MVESQAGETALLGVVPLNLIEPLPMAITADRPKDLLFKGDGEVFLPLYEGKLFWHFDHRFASYDLNRSGKGGRGLPEMPLEKHQDPYYSVVPRYWVSQEEVDAKLNGT